MNTNARKSLRQAHSYMLPNKEQTHITEAYVASPPALFIIDEANNHWTLGYKYLRPEAGAPKGEFGFEVLRNGINTGEIASRIERHKGKIRIFTRTGYKIWSGNSFV